MKRFSGWMTIAALGCVMVSSGVAAEDTCGGKGQKPCPLQGWMEDNVEAPFKAGDMDKVAAALEKASKLAPDPKWNEGDTGWEKLAKQGAAAAKAGDKKALKASCKGCHKAHRKQYQKQHRTRPIKD